MNGCKQVCHFMVRNPVCAYLWQPLSLIRQTMLVHSFSFLPVPKEEHGKTNWFFISDLILAKHLRKAATKTDIAERLKQTLETAVNKDGLKLQQAHTCNPDETIPEVLEKSHGLPIIVQDKGNILGILTPFDVL